MTDSPPVTDRDVDITRAFAAPRDVVWRFFTEPALLASWFGPHAYSTEDDARDMTAAGWEESFARIYSELEGANR